MSLFVALVLLVLLYILKFEKKTWFCKANFLPVKKFQEMGEKSLFQSF